MKVFLYLGKKDKDIYRLKVAVDSMNGLRLVRIVNDMLAAYKMGEKYIFPFRYVEDDTVICKVRTIPIDIENDNEILFSGLDDYEVNPFLKEIIRGCIRQNNEKSGNTLTDKRKAVSSNVSSKSHVPSNQASKPKSNSKPKPPPVQNTDFVFENDNSAEDEINDKKEEMVTPTKNKGISIVVPDKSKNKECKSPIITVTNSNSTKQDTELDLLDDNLISLSGADEY